MSAHVAVPGPNGTVGSFSSSGGVSLSSESFSFAGHSDGSNGVAGGTVGTGSGSVDLIFTLDTPAQVQFQGSEPLLSNLIFEGTATLSMNGSVVVPLTFNDLGQLDEAQNLAAGSYELQASGVADAGIGNSGNVSENITATIVPEPVTCSLIGLIPIAALYLRGKYCLR